MQAIECAHEGLEIYCDHRLLCIQEGQLLLRDSDDFRYAIEDFRAALGRPVHLAAYEGLVTAYLEEEEHKKVGINHSITHGNKPFCDCSP